MTKFELDQTSIRRLASLANKENLAEIEVGCGDDFVRITRTHAGTTVAHAPMVVPSAPVASPVVPTSVAGDTPTPSQAHTGDTNHDDAVKSPIVGTAYLSASPDSDPFVSVGTSVSKGDTLLIVEAMKVMNPIVAPQSGTVTAVLVDNAEPVEFDQPLVVIG